jgi:mono/diheme cytochrome c family protein
MITSSNAFWRGTFALGVVIPTQMKPRKIRSRVTKLALAIALIFPATAQAENPSTSVGDLKKGIQPILEQHCYDCHGREKTKGKVNPLSPLSDLLSDALKDATQKANS